MHISSALAVLAVAHTVTADWTIALRDATSRLDRQIWGSGGGCQRFGSSIGYKCAEWSNQDGHETSGCTTSNWRGQTVIGVDGGYCWIYARGDCTGDDNNRRRVDRGEQFVGLPSGGNINSFSCSG